MGGVWFTESNASKLATFNPMNHTFKEYRTPWVGDMWGVVTDQKGSVWFTQYSGNGPINPGGSIVQGGDGRIVYFNVATKNFTAIALPLPGSFPMRLTLDQRGRVWFSEFLGNRIGVYDPVSSRLQEYRIPTNSSGPTDLMIDSRGDVWFSESYARQVGRFFTRNETFTEYQIGAETASQIVSSPVGIALDRRGNVWLGDHGGNWIVEFNPTTGVTVKYPTHFPPESIYPISLVNDLLVDSRGFVWFTEHTGNSIGYYDPEKKSMVEFSIPTGPISTTLWLTIAPNGDIWFAEWSGNKIGVVRSDFILPLSISSINSLTINNGQETDISLQIQNSQADGNGSLRYSWGSYNPNDVTVTFSPQYPVLSGPSEISAKAQLMISPKTEAGNYAVAFGVETSTVSVWTVVSVDVVKSNASNSALTLRFLVAGGAAALAFAILLLSLQKRRRKMKPSLGCMSFIRRLSVALVQSMRSAQLFVEHLEVYCARWVGHKNVDSSQTLLIKHCGY